MGTRKDSRQRSLASVYMLSGVAFIAVAWLTANALHAPHPVKQALFAATFWIVAPGLISSWSRHRHLSQVTGASDPRLH